MKDGEIENEEGKKQVGTYPDLNPECPHCL
jgi:hypothetical protein